MSRPKEIISFIPLIWKIGPQRFEQNCLKNQILNKTHISWNIVQLISSYLLISTEFIHVDTGLFGSHSPYIK